MTRRHALAALLALLVVLPAGGAWGGPPTEQLRRSVELVLRVLEDPELKREGRTAERRAAVRAIANQIFDFTEISRRALGRHWQARTPPERDEFVRLFADLLERSYITKIESYTGEHILYPGEVVDGDVAIVRTRIVTRQGAEIPVDYRMLRQSERWRAYDVQIEGVSLVANYRTQFNAILVRASYPELIARLRAKQDERPGARETGRREEAAAPESPPSPRRQSP